MSGSEVEDENILLHLNVAMAMATKEHQESHSLAALGVSPEYACLRSMMMKPQNPTMWNSMALVYLMTGRYEDAQDAVERSLELDSSISWTWSIWGDLLAQLGDDIESERAYRMAQELGSNDAHVLNQLVRFFFNRGNYYDALETLQILLPKCPDNQSLWDLYTQCLMTIHQKM